MAGPSLMRVVALSFLLCASSCVATLPASAWITELPRGECLVTVERSDATGSWTLEHHYAADGRVLSGTARLHYHGSAWERFVYDADGRLVEIFSYEDLGAEDFPCEAEGGCYTPPLRRLASVRYEHDAAGRVSRRIFEQHTYGRSDDGEYRARGSSEAGDVHYRYDEAGRLVEARGEGTTRFEHRGDRLMRVVTDAHYPRRTEVEHDEDGRIASTSHESCTPSYECSVDDRATYTYDEQDRLVRTDHVDPDGETSPRYTMWEYEGARAVRVTRVEVRANGEERRVNEYAYDERGRLVSRTEDGRVSERRRYEGACDAVVTGPSAPSAEADLGAHVCRRSSAYVLDECWTAE